jgi:hypothetical protein
MDLPVLYTSSSFWRLDTYHNVPSKEVVGSVTDDGTGIILLVTAFFSVSPSQNT